MYSIKEIADLAGVSTRTLRYYDQLGLLRPAEIGENGYRRFSQENLLSLQQVLFFRELDLPLREIGLILNNPDFAPQEALLNHRRALNARARRIAQLLRTLEKTIASLQGEIAMSAKEIFEGFDETRSEEETRERWGDTPQYRESRKKWSSYSADQKNQIKQDGGRITQRMVTKNPQAQPDDPAVQQAVGDYFSYLNQYFYTCEVEFLRELAEMWVADPRFAVNYERIREGGAAFARDAVKIYCDRNGS